MKSLAEALGIKDPENPELEAPAHPPKLTAKAFARGILDSAQYRESIRRRVLMGNLPPAVECKLYEYAYGKPIDKVEVRDTTDRLEDMSNEQLEAKAMALLALAQKLKEEPGAILH